MAPQEEEGALAGNSQVDHFIGFQNKSISILINSGLIVQIVGIRWMEIYIIFHGKNLSCSTAGKSIQGSVRTHH